MSRAFTIFSAVRKFWPGPASFPRDHMMMLGWFLLRSKMCIRDSWNSLLGIHNFKAEGDGEFARNRQAWYKRLCERCV